MTIKRSIGVSVCFIAALLVAAAVRSGQTAHRGLPGGMVYVDGGVYKPLYVEASHIGSVVRPLFLGYHALHQLLHETSALMHPCKGQSYRLILSTLTPPSLAGTYY